MTSKTSLIDALKQAEAGLEVAVGRLAQDGKDRGNFKPSEVLALECVRAALAPRADPAAVPAESREELARRLVAEAAGLEAIKLPPHDPTIVIESILGEYDSDDREEIWESIKAYADIHARGAVLAARPDTDHFRDATQMMSGQCLHQIAEPAEPSPTAGMNIAQRIMHVGGRNNAAGYVEFGSIQAVEALVRQVLRDLPVAPGQPPSNQADSLYAATNEMMAHLGRDGEINTRHPAVDAVMAALHGVDGGSPYAQADAPAAPAAAACTCPSGDGSLRWPCPTHPPAAAAGPALDAHAVAAAVCQRVAELPDRSSPQDWPEAMLVTGPELIDAVACEIEQAQAAPADDMESEQCRCEPSEWSPPPGYDGDGSVAALARAALAAAPQAQAGEAPVAPMSTAEARAALAATPEVQAELHEIAIEELSQLGYTFDGSKMRPPEYVGELMAVVQASPCGCREGECETKANRACRMTAEIAATAKAEVQQVGSYVTPSGELKPDVQVQAEYIDMLIEQIVDSQKEVQAEPVANCYSDDDGDSWRDSPVDFDFVDGLELGDVFELQASIRSWPETFRVTKVPDETSDDYEVEPVSVRTAPQATQPQAPAAPWKDHNTARLVNDLRDCAKVHHAAGQLRDRIAYIVAPLCAQLKAAQAAPDAPPTHAGLLAAAAHIQAKAQAHAEEYGSYDPDTGAIEMSNSNQEHFNTLDELAEEIRLIADKVAPCNKPPSGWTCSRAPGHDGPCAAAPAAPDERDIEIAGLSASVGHLSALVDSQHALLEKAKATMAALHSTVSPVNESRGDLDARIPASAFARFVEAHAELLDAMAQSPVAAPAAPAVDALDATDRECLAIGRAVNRAALELPADGEIRIDIENGAGAVYVYEPKREDHRYIDSGDVFSAQINAAIDAAIQAAKGAAS